MKQSYMTFQDYEQLLNNTYLSSAETGINLVSIMKHLGISYDDIDKNNTQQKEQQELTQKETAKLLKR